MNAVTSITGNGRNKLRTYKLFKSEYGVENYCKVLVPFNDRSAFAKFRCGVAPIRLETGRNENRPRLIPTIKIKGLFILPKHLSLSPFLLVLCSAMLILLCSGLSTNVRLCCYFSVCH